MSSFADLGIPSDLLDALHARNLVEAYPIQTATIPEALAGRDVSGRAPTGSGKTLAFGIPLVANIQRAKPKRPRGLVLVPTRELAAQVARDLTWLGMERGIRVHSFYGGVGFDAQLKALRAGVDIAVACPGRLADLINQGRMRLDGVDHVVIDEADRMADMGFLPEVRRLLDRTADERQTLLFSATLDGDVDVLVKNYQTNPIRHEVDPPDADHRLVSHNFWTVDKPKRTDLCASIIDRAGPTIVFTRTRHGADRLARQLDKLGISTAAIHGDRSQRQRDRALADFTSGRARALIATDVAARGIHVDAVACVVHHDLPADEKDYVHRSGRTGRAGAEGIVVAMVMPDQRKDANKIRRKLDLDIQLVAPDLSLFGDGSNIPPRHPRPDSESAGRSRNGGGGKNATNNRRKPRRSADGDRFENRNARKGRPGERDTTSERGEGRPRRESGDAPDWSPSAKPGNGAGRGPRQGSGGGRKPSQGAKPGHAGSRPGAPKRHSNGPSGAGRNTTGQPARSGASKSGSQGRSGAPKGRGR